MLRNIVSFIIVVSKIYLIWSIGLLLLYLGPQALTYGPFETESPAKYPGLNRSQNDVNTLNERMGH